MRIEIPTYILATLTASLGGLLNGLDTGSIGALVEMEQFHASIGHLPPTLLGFTVSLIMLTGALPSIFAGQLADRFGRLKVIVAGVLLFVVGAVLQGAAGQLGMLLAGRAIAGLGEGVFLSNVAVYICEIAPVRQRGTLAGLPQFMSTAGVCSGYFICYGTVHVESSMAWRAPYVIQAGLGVLTAVLCWQLPDSPRWLVHQGRRTEALAALQRLDFSMVEAEKDILSVQNEQNLSLGPWQGLMLLFRRGYRARTVLALFVLGMVQLSGIDGVLYYAPQLFRQAGLPAQTASFLASGLSAILMLAISVPAFLFADKWGRRTSAITGGVGLSGCMLLIGALYASDVVHPYGIARWVVIVSVFVFGLVYCATWGIVGKIYASEIQPAHTRAAANCVAQGLGFFTNWLVAMLTPILLDTSAYGAYFLFGFLALGTVMVLGAYMPETRGRSLEDIQNAFHHQGPQLRSMARRIGKWFGSSRSVHSSSGVSDGSLVELNTMLAEGPERRSAEEGVMASGAIRVNASA